MLCVDHRIPKTGMAFGTKSLFFADGYRRAVSWTASFATGCSSMRRFD